MLDFTYTIVMSKVSKIFKGAGMLAFCSLVAKMIGALYRIPLTNIVGAEGIGLYQMVFPLYTVLLTVSSGGLPIAISKVVAGKIASGDQLGARKVLAVSLVSLTILGAIASLLIVVGRDKIAFIQGNDKAALAYLGIAPSLVFVAILACFRGYYQGVQNMLPSALSQLIEQVGKLAIGLTLSKMLLPYGVEFAVFGALLGVTASELIAMIGLLIQFYFTNRKWKKQNFVDVLQVSTYFESSAELTNIKPRGISSTSSILKNIYKVAIPVTLGSLVLPITQVIDSILVINILVANGQAINAATSLYGLINGPINSLINMPIVITLSIAVAILPKIATAMTAKKDISKITSTSIKLSYMIGLFSAMVLFLFSKPILVILYSTGLSASQIELGGKLLQLGSLSVIYVSILQVSTSVLQGVDKAHKPAINLLIGACFKVAMTVILLPIFGIVGAVAATVFCYAITCVLDVISMRKYSKTILSFHEFFLSPLIAAGASGLVGILLYKLLSSFLPLLVALITALVIAGAIYSLLILVTKGLNAEELESVPILGKLLNKRRKAKQKKD